MFLMLPNYQTSIIVLFFVWIVFKKVDPFFLQSFDCIVKVNMSFCCC
jgi:hypothetical protein